MGCFKQRKQKIQNVVMWTEHGIWGTMSNSVWLSMEEVNEPWGWRSQMDRLERVVLKGPVQNLSFDWWSLFPGGWWHHLICFSAEQCFSVLAAHHNNMGSFKKKKKSWCQTLHFSSIKQEFPEVGFRYSVVLKSSPGDSNVQPRLKTTSVENYSKEERSCDQKAS